ncbi:MAG: hypothetical protein R3C68_15735 [Myxococcota bacterium]
MPIKFDSRPLVMRRVYTATMRATVVLGWRDQVHHGMHLFFVIAAAVVSRAVANQQVLDAAGSEILGTLYAIVALIGGLCVAALGWFARNHDVGRLVRIVHLCVAASMGLAFLLPSTRGFAIAKYVAMELNAGFLLLIFGLTLGARLGPRDTRRSAARVGTGGIIGGLAGGAINLLATLVGSPQLFLIAAALAVAPVFWLPRVITHGAPVQRVTRDRAEVPELQPYGYWVAAATLVMVAATTLIDYQFRYAAVHWFDADEMTAFFGFVSILAGCTTVAFQLTFLERLLDRYGVFVTATVMPISLIIAAAMFGLFPAVFTLVVLKMVDSGANMSVQQATGVFCSPPGPARARCLAGAH